MIEEYLSNIKKSYDTKVATEHTYRGALSDLIHKISKDIEAVNEPIRQACGAPDYILLRRGIPIGYIEAKDLDVRLDNIEKSEQLKRYLSSLDNLMLTNYIEFRFYREGKKNITITVAEIRNGKIEFDSSKFTELENTIREFCAYGGISIRTAAQLSKIMAGKAIIIKDIIVKTLNNSKESTLKKQLEYFKQVILHDLDENSFADMYAQTIVYGLFAARLNAKSSPEEFNRQMARELVSKNNPFLMNLFDYLSGAKLEENLIWIVNDLSEIFRLVDLEKIFENFDRTDISKDPFLDFYETFLKQYDAITKQKRGVYYTPVPIVRFMVNATDEIIRNKFNLQNGLADASTIKKTIIVKKVVKSRGKYKEQEVPEEKEFFKVQILDPCTGTGTYLAETIKKIHNYYKNQQGMWDGYVKEVLIPRLNGFEIMMTPYVMCHIKLGMVLRNTGYQPDNKNERFNVYLTNSLEKEEIAELPLFDFLSEEAKSANIIKTEKPIMVVIGNPPYRGESANGTIFKEEISVYKKESTGENLRERSKKWINDDYVKFTRLAQMFIEPNREGILAFINNRSFIENPTFRGMRYSLLSTFDEIYIFDLHGYYGEKQDKPDENVFQIKQGVSINIYVKTGKKTPGTLAKVYYAEQYGTKAEKFSFLNQRQLSDIPFEEVNTSAPMYFFKPVKIDGEWKKYISVEDVFKTKGVGITTAHDSFVIDSNKESLINRFEKFKTSAGNATELHRDFKVKEKKAGIFLADGEIFNKQMI